MQDFRVADSFFYGKIKSWEHGNVSHSLLVIINGARVAPTKKIIPAKKGCTFW